MVRLCLLVATAWATVVAGASGQGVGVLSASFLEVAGDVPTRVGDALVLRVVGMDGEGRAQQRAWPAGAEGAWLFVRAQGHQWNLEDADRLPVPGGRWTRAIEKPGVTMVGLDLPPSEVALDAQTRRALASRLGPDAAAILNDRVDRLWRVESMKVLVRTSSDEPFVDVATALSKSGQSAEIRALADPTLLVPGGELAVRVYAAGGGASGAEVVATSATTGVRTVARADRSGIAMLPIPNSGVWRVEFVHLSDGGEGGVPTLSIGTLTFSVREGGER